MGRLVALLALISLLLAGCVGSPVGFRVTVSGDTKIATGGAVELRAVANATSYTLSWKATDGAFVQSKTNAEVVVWKAPSVPGVYTVTVTAVSKTGQEATTTKNISVIKPPIEIISWSITSDPLGPAVLLRIQNNGAAQLSRLTACMMMWDDTGGPIYYGGAARTYCKAHNIDVAPSQIGSVLWRLSWADGVSSVLPWIAEAKFADETQWSL